MASYISGTQRLPNGNTLVNHGPRGCFFEVRARDGAGPTAGGAIGLALRYLAPKPR
jgi:hypothetical protein